MWGILRGVASSADEEESAPSSRGGLFVSIFILLHLTAATQLHLNYW
jgi:hypothetical protein